MISRKLKTIGPDLQINDDTQDDSTVVGQALRKRAKLRGWTTAQWASNDSKLVQTGHFLITESYYLQLNVVLDRKGFIDEYNRGWEFIKLGRDDIATNDANFQSKREHWCI